MIKIKEFFNKIKCLFKHKKIYKVNTNVFSFDKNGQYVNSNGRVYTKEQINENILKNFKCGEIIHPSTSFSLSNALEAYSIDQNIADCNIDMQTINDVADHIKNGNAEITPKFTGDINNPQFTSFDVTIKNKN